MNESGFQRQPSSTPHHLDVLARSESYVEGWGCAC